MADETYNPDQARALIPGVSASTIRNWCRDFAPMLSDGANPPTGRERRLTLDDIAKLQQVKALRDSGRRVEDIRALLQAAASANSPAQLTIDAVATSQAAQDATDNAHAPLALVAAHTTLQSRVDDLARHIERVEQSQRDRLNMFVTGVLVGGVVVLIVVALVLAMGNG